MLELPYGVYHVAAEGDCTWAEFAEAIFEEAGLDCRVRRISSAELGRAGAAARVLGAAQREGRAATAALARGAARCPGGDPRGVRAANSGRMASYSFLTTWMLDAPQGEVWDAIYHRALARLVARA